VDLGRAFPRGERGRDEEKAPQRKSLQGLIFKQSGRRDLNPRPPEPHPRFGSATCARGARILRASQCFTAQPAGATTLANALCARNVRSDVCPLNEPAKHSRTRPAGRTTSAHPGRQSVTWGSYDRE
jgi:hypothetical protein